MRTREKIRVLKLIKNHLSSKYNTSLGICDVLHILAEWYPHIVSPCNSPIHYGINPPRTNIRYDIYGTQLKFHSVGSIIGFWWKPGDIRPRIMAINRALKRLEKKTWSKNKK